MTKQGMEKQSTRVETSSKIASDIFSIITTPAVHAIVGANIVVLGCWTWNPFLVVNAAMMCIFALACADGLARPSGSISLALYALCFLSWALIGGN